MRIAFMGTPDFAVPTLERLIADGHDIAAVYTQPPRPAGRGKALRASPVQQTAEAAGLIVRSPTSLRDAVEQEEFHALGIDAAVVAAYGLILPQPILDAPPLGCFNVHASLLPRWRGAAPVQRAIVAGDAETGVTIMRMERGLDTGPMLIVRRTTVADKTAGALTEELGLVGADAMAAFLDAPDLYPDVPQPEEGITYAGKLEKCEARLDFSRGAAEVLRQVRAFAPTPGAFFEHAGNRIRVLDAQVVPGNGSPGSVLDDVLAIACKDGAIRPTRVGRDGRGIMDAADLLRGFAIPPGTQLA